METSSQDKMLGCSNIIFWALIIYTLLVPLKANAGIDEDEYARQDKRLNVAYKAVIKSIPELRTEQRQWIKDRDSSCLEPEKAIEVGATQMQCLAEMTEQRAIKLENLNTTNISTTENKTDINTIAGNTWVNYYNGGITAVINNENECWSRLKTADYETAGECYITAIAGATLEAGYAQKQGRIPAPFYQPEVMSNRSDENLNKAGISAKELMDKAPRFIHNNMLNEIMIGFQNAGMK